jgi:Ca-activated chloride channel family protein
MQMSHFRFGAILMVVAMLFAVVSTSVFAQSKPQRPETPQGEGKRNSRPVPKTEEELKKEAEEKARQELEKNAVVDPGVEKVESNIVNVDAVVYNKKTGQIITGLKKENFAIFEDGVKQNISNFATPEAPITVTLVVEYSKWTELFGRAQSGGWEPGTYEVIKPVASFLTRFIKPPNDYASVIAFDIRPTPITDFTNDPARINATINVLLRNYPAFRENNVFDAIKFSLYGGKTDAVVLDNKDDKAEWQQYGGMVDVKAKRRAIILVTSGIDTFSKITFSDTRKLVQEAGVPIYIISTANMFFKRYENQLPDTDSVITGLHSRLTFLKATNDLRTFAKDSGGQLFEMTFEAEVNSYLESINALLRSQYSMGYDIDQPHTPGKKYKIEVKVDVDGDGVYDDKQYVVQNRGFYIAPGAPEKKK